MRLRYIILLGVLLTASLARVGVLAFVLGTVAPEVGSIKKAMNEIRKALEP